MRIDKIFVSLGNQGRRTRSDIRF